MFLIIISIIQTTNKYRIIDTYINVDDFKQRRVDIDIDHENCSCNTI